MTRLRVAIIASHPIQHFAPWHRDLAAAGELDARVFFCCDWGQKEYHDPGFGLSLAWDVPLLEGYAHEFLAIRRRPRRLGFWEVDNPEVGHSLDAFDPHVVQVFGWARRTNWRVRSWAMRRARRLLLFSDSNSRERKSAWWRLLWEPVVRRFYKAVDGALFVGDNNREFHARFGLPPDRLFSCPYPVDRRRLLARVAGRDAARRAVRERHGIAHDAPLVLFCGKYIARKRPADLLAAVRQARQAGHPELRALLVGEGPLRAEIEALAREVGSGEAVVGFVNQSAMPAYYCAADLLMVPSSRDPHPLIVSEAAVFGLPCLVSDAVGCVGPNDTARTGANAMVYPCGDIPAAVAEIGRYFSDAALRRSMALEAERIGELQDSTVAAVALVRAAAAIASQRCLREVARE